MSNPRRPVSYLGSLTVSGAAPDVRADGTVTVQGDGVVWMLPPGGASWRFRVAWYQEGAPLTPIRMRVSDGAVRLGAYPRGTQLTVAVHLQGVPTGGWGVLTGFDLFQETNTV